MRTLPRVVAAFVATSALGAGAIWFLDGTREAPGPIAPWVAPVADVEAPRAETDLVDASQESSSAERAVEAPESGARAAAATTVEVELSRAHWVEGRVVFPPGTPADEEAFVRADGRNFSDGSEHRVRVEADGRFRVAFSAKSRTGTLRLEARYLFLEEPRAWQRGADGAIVLEPRLGGRLVARFLPPSGVAPSELGGHALLLSDSGAVVVFGNGEFGSRELDANATLEFGGLRPKVEHRLHYEGPRHVVDSASVTVEAGRTETLELPARAGLAVSGRVRDEDGNPLARVDVRVQLRTETGRIAARTTQSSKDGTWSVDAVDPGALELNLRLEGFETLEELHAPPASGWTVQLDSVLRRGHSIAGRVRWPDGSPAAAALALTPIPDGERMRLGHYDAIEVSASEDGTFTASGLTPGAYHLRAWATKVSEVPEVSAVTGLERTRKERALWSVELERVDVGTSGLELVLDPGLVVRGVVRDAGGAPLKSVRISSWRTSFPSPSWDRREGPSGRCDAADGSFALAGFQPGTWVLRASARERVDSAPVEVRLPGAGPIELVVEREAFLRGVVLDTDGEPAHRARVEVRQPEVADPSLEHGADRSTDVSDETGAFELDGLHGGRTLLSVASPNGTPGESLELDLVAGETRTGIVLRLKPGCSLEGEVVDRHGRPEAGRLVHFRVQDQRHNASRTTDEEGRFSAHNLPEGSATVFVESREGLMLTGRAELSPGATARVRLAPPVGTPVRMHGRVLAGGAPLADVYVAAWMESSSSESPQVRVDPSDATDAQGAYELVLPASGRWQASVHGEASGVRYWQTTLDVPAADAWEHDFELSLARISGRVRNASGDPVAEAWVRSEPRRHDGGPRGSSTARTDADGRFELVVAAGAQVVVSGGDHGMSDDPSEWSMARSAELHVAEGEHRQGVELVLRLGGTLTGIVRGPGGTAVGHAWLHATDAVGMHRIGASDEHGAFHIGGIEAGTHWVRASHGNLSSPSAVAVAIRAGEETRVDFALVPGRMETVRVVDAAGAPLGCEIAAVDADGRAVPIQDGDALGAVRIGPLPPGRYRITVRREDKSFERALEVSSAAIESETVLTFP